MAAALVTPIGTNDKPEVRMPKAPRLAEQRLPPAPTGPIHLQERKEIFRSWLEGAEYVCAQTKNVKAQEVLDLLKQKGTVVDLMGESNFTFESKPVEDMFFIVPMLQHDVGFGPTWQKRAAIGASAMFDPNANMVIVKDRKIGRVWKGLLLLHEGDHVLTFGRERYDHSNTRIYCEKERDTHAFENELLVALGGKAYKEIVRKEAVTLFRLRFSGDDLQFEIPDQPVRSLEDIFGPPESEDEEATRKAAVLVDIAFEAIDTKYGRGEKAEEAKTSFMQSVYKK